MIQAAPMALALAAALSVCAPAHAASIGHSRLVSASGQPLHIHVPLRDLSQADLQSLRVDVAPAAAWQQAGLVPPVELSSLRLSIDEGFTPKSCVVQIRSSQPFDGPVADLLLQIATAAGSQQYQVSLLTHSAPPGSAAAGQAAPASTGAAAGGSAASAAAGAGSIAVRRGDTLFALAQAHAVQGVSVYQMMIALQKANPQAFIDGNVNLVKAGATLAIPDAQALRAVSDREARRIYQQHAQAYAAYRQGVASRRAQAVQGGSAQQGRVSGASARVSARPAGAAGDQVVLSSGSASDAANDEQEATRRNIDESQARVSHLERNVHSLNQALQMQGEAAKEAVLNGAAAVGQTLSDAATSIGASEEASPGSAESGAGQSGSAQGAGGQAAASGSNADASSPGGASGSGGGASAEAAQGQGASSANGSNAASSGEAVQGSAAGQAPAGSGAAGNAAGDADSASAQGDSNSSTSSKAEQSVSWFQENLLGVITAVLALVVLIIAWVLRRASASRSDDGQGGVTEAMVQERLEKIDLDLNNPPAEGQPPRGA